MENCIEQETFKMIVNNLECMGLVITSNEKSEKNIIANKENFFEKRYEDLLNNFDVNKIKIMDDMIDKQKITLIDNVNIGNLDQKYENETLCCAVMLLDNTINETFVVLLRKKSFDKGAIEISKKLLESSYANANILMCKLINNAVNIIDNAVIITDCNFNILYSNNVGTQMINDIEDEEYINKELLRTPYCQGQNNNFDVPECLSFTHCTTHNKLSYTKNIVDVFPTFSVLINENDTNKKYKNRKLVVNVNEREAESVTNSILIQNKVFHITIIKKTTLSTSVLYYTKMLGYLSHELRNYLHVINLGINVILMSIKKEMPKKNYDCFDKITTTLEDMNVIINDVNDLAKLEANEMVLNIEECNVRNTIKDIIEEFDDIALEKQMSVSCSINPNVPKTFYTDHVRLHQILYNLVSNSFKYSNGGKVSINIDFVKDNIIFSIKDEGVGIKELELENLFTDFGLTSSIFRMNNKNTKSSGLGLSISQKIAKLLGGNIKVESKVDEGSTFFLYHPVKLEKSETSFDSLTNFVDYMEGNILVVDDNENCLTFFKLLIDNINAEFKTNINIDLASNYEETLKCCKLKKYDIIFIDYNLDKINGIKVIEKIKEKNLFSGNFVIVTGNITIKNSNVGSIMYKPFTEKHLMNVLKKYL